MRQLCVVLVISSWLGLAGAVDLNVVASSLPGRSAAVLPEVLNLEVPVARQIPPPVWITAPSYAVFDRRSGSLLAAKLEREQVAPASTIKMLTALTALRLFEPNQSILISSPALEEKSVLQLGDELSVGDALRALLISSSNQVAESLAAAAPGGRAVFIQEMNRVAQNLGLNDTAATNPTGFDEQLQRSSVRDLTLLADALLTNSMLSQVVAQKEVLIRPRNRAAEILISTTNSLLLSDSEAAGIKTGTTPWAGEVLVSRFVSPQYDLVVVVHGSQDRFVDTRALVSWVRNTFRYQPLSLDAMIY